MLHQILHSNLWAAEVPERSDFFAINRSGQLSFDPDYNTIEGGWRYFEGDYSQFRILGTVTKDSISFDVEPYLDNEHDNFYSLLSSNGILFINPWSDEKPKPTWDGSSWEHEDVRIWERFQKEVVKKILILQPI